MNEPITGLFEAASAVENADGALKMLVKSLGLTLDHMDLEFNVDMSGFPAIVVQGKILEFHSQLYVMCEFLRTVSDELRATTERIYAGAKGEQRNEPL